MYSVTDFYNNVHCYNQYNDNYPVKLAQAYVPFQYLGRMYPPMTGLKKGTVFPELDKPYGADAGYTVDT